MNPIATLLLPAISASQVANDVGNFPIAEFGTEVQPNGGGLVPAFRVFKGELVAGINASYRRCRSLFCRCHSEAIHMAPSVAPSPAPMTIKLEVLACPRRCVGPGMPWRRRCR